MNPPDPGSKIEMNTDSVTITIEYLLENDATIYRIELLPHEYYDGKYVDRGDEFQDTIPLFDMPIEYIHHSHKEQVIFTRLIIIDNKHKEEQITHYWSKQRNWICECFDNKNQGRHEIIVVTNPNTDQHFSEIIRFEEKNGVFTPAHHSFYYTNSAGQEIDRVVPVQNALVVASCPVSSKAGVARNG